MSLKSFLSFIFLLTVAPCLASDPSDKEKKYKITVDEFGTTRDVDQMEYEKWLAQKRKERAQQLQQQRNQQLQQQIQNQLSQMKGGGGGGGGGGGSKGGNSSKVQPLNADAFGKMPDFSQQSGELEKLVAESAKPDRESAKLLEKLQKKMEEASQLKGLPPIETDNTALDSFSMYLQSALMSLRTNALFNAARKSAAKRVVGRPSPVPSGLGIVAGQSRSPRRNTPAYRGLAGSLSSRTGEKDLLLPRALRGRAIRRPLNH